MIHLRRFDLDYETFETVKLNDRFMFPMRLDMAPYIDKGAPPPPPGGEGAEEAGGAEGGEAKGMDVVGGEDDEGGDGGGGRGGGGGDDDEFVYELQGVLAHSGVAQGGHYYSFIKERTSESVSESSQHNNDGEGGGETKSSSTSSSLPSSSSSSPSSPAGDRWFRFDDDRVTPWDPSQMEEDCFGGEYFRVLHGGKRVRSERRRNALMLFYERVRRTTPRATCAPRTPSAPKGTPGPEAGPEAGTGADGEVQEQPEPMAVEATGQGEEGSDRGGGVNLYEDQAVAASLAMSRRSEGAFEGSVWRSNTSFHQSLCRHETPFMDFVLQLLIDARPWFDELAAANAGPLSSLSRTPAPMLPLLPKLWHGDARSMVQEAFATATSAAAGAAGAGVGTMPSLDVTCQWILELSIVQLMDVTVRSRRPYLHGLRTWADAILAGLRSNTQTCAWFLDAATGHRRADWLYAMLRESPDDVCRATLVKLLDGAASQLFAHDTRATAARAAAAGAAAASAAAASTTAGDVESAPSLQDLVASRRALMDMNGGLLAASNLCNMEARRLRTRVVGEAKDGANGNGVNNGVDTGVDDTDWVLRPCVLRFPSNAVEGSVDPPVQAVHTWTYLQPRTPALPPLAAENKEQENGKEDVEIGPPLPPAHPVAATVAAQLYPSSVAADGIGPFPIAATPLPGLGPPLRDEKGGAAGADPGAVQPPLPAPSAGPVGSLYTLALSLNDMVLDAPRVAACHSDELFYLAARLVRSHQGMRSLLLGMGMAARVVHVYMGYAAGINTRCSFGAPSKMAETLCRGFADHGRAATRALALRTRSRDASLRTSRSRNRWPLRPTMAPLLSLLKALVGLDTDAYSPVLTPLLQSTAREQGGRAAGGTTGVTVGGRAEGKAEGKAGGKAEGKAEGKEPSLVSGHVEDRALLLTSSATRAFTACFHLFATMDGGPSSAADGAARTMLMSVDDLHHYILACGGCVASATAPSGELGEIALLGQQGGIPPEGSNSPFGQTTPMGNRGNACAEDEGCGLEPTPVTPDWATRVDSIFQFAATCRTELQTRAAQAQQAAQAAAGGGAVNVVESSARHLTLSVFLEM